jgi:hypothetical protein
MKKPINVNELKELIKLMKHRERFVFDTVGEGTLEVYYTILFESKTCDENILFVSIDKNGDQTKKSKLLKLFTEDFWERLYKMIK